MKINKKKLQEIVDKAVETKLETLKESTDFTAKRQLIYSAQNASMEFENEIVKALNLIAPDQLPAHLQQKYYEIAEEMKNGIVDSVTRSVSKFATLPRKEAAAGTE